MASRNVKRQGTMQETAAEGIQYLKDNKEDFLLKVQGLAEEEKKLEKQATMESTAKEGEMLLEWMGGKPNPDAKTRAQEKAMDEAGPPAKKKKASPPPKEPKAKAEPKRKGKKEEDAKKTEEEVPSIRKTHTMQATKEEAETLVDSKEMGESRSATAAIKKAEEVKPSKSRKKKVEEELPEPKKDSTMKQTAKEGRDFVKGKKTWD